MQEDLTTSGKGTTSTANVYMHAENGGSARWIFHKRRMRRRSFAGEVAITCGLYRLPHCPEPGGWWPGAMDSSVPAKAKCAVTSASYAGWILKRHSLAS